MRRKKTPKTARREEQTVCIDAFRNPENKIVIAVWKCWECGVARPVGVKDPQSGVIIPLSQFSQEERERIQRVVWEANRPKGESGEPLSSLGLKEELKGFVFVVVSNRYCGC